MQIPIYQIDAFTDSMFGGNPAAVCLLKEWIEPRLMQSIAAENNLAETAFVVLPTGEDPSQQKLEIRWFTPAVEVDLCGHATLAASCALFQQPNCSGDHLQFWSHRSGDLACRRSSAGFTLNFPEDRVAPTDIPEVAIEALGVRPQEAYAGREDLLLVFANQAEVAGLDPDFRQLRSLPHRGIIATAAGHEVDFVSRFFGPAVGIDEDPVTGSAHTSLTPFWSQRLEKNPLVARQISRRGGQLTCQWTDSRVELTGAAVTYLVGQIQLP